MSRVSQHACNHVRRAAEEDRQDLILLWTAGRCQEEAKGLKTECPVCQLVYPIHTF